LTRYKKYAILYSDEKKLPASNESANRIYKLRRDLSPTNPRIAHSSEKAKISQREKKLKIHIRQIKLTGKYTPLMTENLISATPQSEKRASWWEGLKKNKKTCFGCKSKQTYRNPMAKCKECENNFCFDCIIAGCINNKMKSNEEVRDICENCFEKYEYHSLLN